MNRACSAAFVLFVAAATNLIANERPRNDEHVRWTPKRNVKGAILKEIHEFGENMKTGLGPKTLAFKPYIAVDERQMTKR